MNNQKSHKDRLYSLLTKVRSERPLVHQITNYVTANDCANVVLAIGGSPVMADDREEVCEIVSLASALVLNLGTLNSRSIDSMILAGRRANELGIPIVLDPVGVGATALRTETAQRIMKDLKLSVVRGNLSEVKALAGLKAATRGVDSADEVEGVTEVAQLLSQRLNAVVAVTGAQDTVCHSEKVMLVDNGHPMLTRVTGTGCMLSALTGVYCGVTKDFFMAATAALVTMGLAGEQAATHAGAGSFRVKLMDCISNLKPEELKEGAKLYVG